MTESLPLPEPPDAHTAAATGLIARIREAPNLPAFFAVIDDPGVRRWRGGHAKTHKDLADQVSAACGVRYAELQAAATSAELARARAARTQEPAS